MDSAAARPLTRGRGMTAADEHNLSREHSAMDASTQSGSVYAGSASMEKADATDSACFNTAGGRSPA